MVSVARDRFSCPVSWCAGVVWDHGGDGLTEPGDWLHTSDPLPLSGSLWAHLWSVGTGPEHWAVYTGQEGAVIEDARTAEDAAAMLESAARRLRAID